MTEKEPADYEGAWKALPENQPIVLTKRLVDNLFERLAVVEDLLAVYAQLVMEISLQMKEGEVSKGAEKFLESLNKNEEK